MYINIKINFFLLINYLFKIIFFCATYKDYFFSKYKFLIKYKFKKG